MAAYSVKIEKIHLFSWWYHVIASDESSVCSGMAFTEKRARAKAERGIDRWQGRISKNVFRWETWHR